MFWTQYKAFVAAFLLCCVIGLPSCGHDQQLVSISIQPATETFGSSTTPVALDAGLSVQLRALGSYIHPPVTKDITAKVTWASNTPGMVTVDSSGVITPTGIDCGNTLVSATVTTNSSVGNLSSSGAIVTGYMTANVVCFTGSGGGSSGPLLTANFSGSGSGSITSSPSGLSCSVTCSQSFPSGTVVTLTATANSGSTFASWGNCDTVSGQVCTVTVTGNRAVNVTFN